MMKNHVQQPSALRATLPLAVALVLTACGGGGGGGTAPGPSPIASVDSTQFQGRWVTTSDMSTAVTAVVVPDAAGQTTAWMLTQDASRLIKLALGSGSSATGMSYALNQVNAKGQALSGQVTVTPTAKPPRMAFTGLGIDAGTQPLTFDRSDAMGTPAVQTDAAGTWHASASDKARTVVWTLADTGQLTGSTTTGCTYAGSLGAMPRNNAYIAQFNQSCPDGVQTAFSGIATVDAQKARMTIVATTADATQGVAIFFAK